MRGQMAQSVICHLCVQGQTSPPSRFASPEVDAEAGPISRGGCESVRRREVGPHITGL